MGVRPGIRTCTHAAPTYTHVHVHTRTQTHTHACTLPCTYKRFKGHPKHVHAYVHIRSENFPKLFSEKLLTVGNDCEMIRVSKETTTKTLYQTKGRCYIVRLTKAELLDSITTKKYVINDLIKEHEEQIASNPQLIKLVQHQQLRWKAAVEPNANPKQYRSVIFDAYMEATEIYKDMIRLLD